MSRVSVNFFCSFTKLCDQTMVMFESSPNKCTHWRNRGVSLSFTQKISFIFCIHPDCEHFWYQKKEKKTVRMKARLSSWLSGLWHNLRKLLIVLYWKNFTLKCRHYVLTALEILVPTLLFVAVLAVFLWGGKGLTPSYQNATMTSISSLPQEYCLT